MNSTELKPCPWCSYPRTPPLLYAHVNASHAGLCAHCGAAGPYADTEELADAAWNRRASINSVVCEASHPMQDGYIESMLISSPELGHRLWIDYATREQADVAQAWLAGETPPPPGSARDSAEADKTKAGGVADLTDEQIDAVIRQHWNPNVFTPMHRAFARAVLAAAGMSAEGWEAKSEPSLSEINELAKTYASSYASPHHITFTVEGLRNLIAASPKAGESRTEPDCVKASGEAQLLHEAHDQLHRLVATFVPGNDGAYTETTDLMRRIREALPGVAFDGGTDGVRAVDPAQAFTGPGERRWSRVMKAMNEAMERAVRAFDIGTADDYGKACIAFDDALAAELDRVTAHGVMASDTCREPGCNNPPISPIHAWCREHDRKGAPQHG